MSQKVTVSGMKVSQKQVRAMHLLARGHSVTDVAGRLKLRRETLSRWKKRTEFNAKLAEIMEQQRVCWQQRL